MKGKLFEFIDNADPHFCAKSELLDLLKELKKDFPKGAYMKLASVPMGLGSEHYFKDAVDRWFAEWFGNE